MLPFNRSVNPDESVVDAEWKRHGDERRWRKEGEGEVGSARLKGIKKIPRGNGVKGAGEKGPVGEA